MWTALNGSRCQGGAPAAQRGRTTLMAGAERFSACSVGVGIGEHRGGYVVVVQRLHSEAYGLGAGPNLRLPVIPSPRKRGHGAVRVQHAGHISTATAPKVRGSDYWAATRVLRPRYSRRHLAGQSADVSVAQPVVDQREQLAGRGDLGDVAAAAGFDPFAIKGDLGDVGLTLDGLHGRPPHKFAALLGDVPATNDGVGFAVCGGQTGPRT